MSTVHPDGSAKRALKVSIAPDGTITAETIGFTGEACLSQIGVLEDLLEATTVRSAFTDEYVITRTEMRPDSRLTTQEGATGGAR
ncbi:DUF2997 domain-containing protein [Actinomyces gerencseriae]|jgi:hypothetical protein|uniref:DUF2997 domain-containing protein n=1 Tax=Actinomyces gerencseriae TaxID=52769 RepID=UPI0023F31947|nr:DUF2997 domain-containing protein [Actinomyces gerencseriae]